MAVLCPMCARDCSGSQTITVIRGATLPVFQCDQCKIGDNEIVAFVLLPDGAKIHPDDAAKYLSGRRDGLTKSKALKMLYSGPE